MIPSPMVHEIFVVVDIILHENLQETGLEQRVYILSLSL